MRTATVAAILVAVMLAQAAAQTSQPATPPPPKPKPGSLEALVASLPPAFVDNKMTGVQVDQIKKKIVGQIVTAEVAVHRVTGTDMAISLNGWTEFGADDARPPIAVGIDAGFGSEGRRALNRRTARPVPDAVKAILTKASPGQIVEIRGTIEEVEYSANPAQRGGFLMRLKLIQPTILKLRDADTTPPAEKQHLVIVECKSAKEQSDLLARLRRQGFTCRPETR